MKFNGKNGSWKQEQRKKVRENKTRNVIMIINVLTFADRITTKSPGGVCGVSYIIYVYQHTNIRRRNHITIIGLQTADYDASQNYTFFVTCVVVICTRRIFSSLNK